MDDKAKYLKYKLKYLQLKESIEGGAPKAKEVALDVSKITISFNNYVNFRTKESFKDDFINHLTTLKDKLGRLGRYTSTVNALGELLKELRKTEINNERLIVLKQNFDDAYAKSQRT